MRTARVLAIAVTLLAAGRAGATEGYAATRYPVVLCHGMAGFDALFGVFDYFYGIESALGAAGADVYLTHVPAFARTEARGEALLAQVEEIVAVSGAPRVNLIGHSHGGLDARYVAAVRPDLVASVTTVGTPHKGADLADYLRARLAPGGFTEDVLSFFADRLGNVLGLLAGRNWPQDSVAALESLTSAGAADFNRRFPLGVPAWPCGGGAPAAQGMRFYSWSGASVLTNFLDVSDADLLAASWVAEEQGDGMVGRCSSHFGTVLRDSYRMNHLDEVNQLLGLVSVFETNPRSVFRAHANRLKLAGL